MSNFNIIFDALGENSTRIVGGYVRNKIMGLPTKDIDFATILKPDIVVNKLRQYGIATDNRHAKYGTILARLNDNSTYEITTLRCDHAHDGRYADVTFTTNWYDDAQRRDFTINALYQDEWGNIHDPTQQGMIDIKNKYVRFIGNPRDRIIEDHLRILRFIRICAYYHNPNTPLCETAVSACAQNHDLLSTLSGQRIMNETIKILTAPYLQRMLIVMEKHNITSHHLPTFFVDNRLDELIKIRDLVSHPDILTLAILCKNHDAVLDYWPLTRQQRQLLTTMWTNSNWHDDTALLYQAFLRGNNIDDTIKRFNTWYARRIPPITASDLLARGYLPDGNIGKTIKIAQQLWQHNPDLTTDELWKKLSAI